MIMFIYDRSHQMPGLRWQEHHFARSSDRWGLLGTVNNVRDKETNLPTVIQLDRCINGKIHLESLQGGQDGSVSVELVATCIGIGELLHTLMTNASGAYLTHVGWLVSTDVVTCMKIVRKLINDSERDGLAGGLKSGLSSTNWNSCAMGPRLTPLC